MAKRKNTEDDFWSKVNFFGPPPAHVPNLGNCWVWTAALDVGGYGRSTFDGRADKAHRQSWALAYGPIPDNLCVLHRCDNRACARPDHLWLGTYADNTQDMISKGRQVVSRGEHHGSHTHPESRPRGESHYKRLRPECNPRGDTHWARARPEKVQRGENRYNAQFTEGDILRIRQRVAAGESQASVAQSFHTKPGNVSNIVRKRTWKHVT